MFKHIIAAVDFSPAWAQMQERLHHLRVQGADRLTLIHVLGHRYPMAPAETHRGHYTERLTLIADELQRDGWQVQCEVRSGEPATELIAAAREHDADVIMLGTHGNSRLHEFFLGSTALDTLRQSRLPVWLEPVHSENIAEPSGTLLLATDGSDGARAAEARFLEMAPSASRAVITAVVTGTHQWASERSDLTSHLEALASRCGDVEIRVSGGEPATAITVLAQQLKADLTVIGKRGRTPMRDLLLGTTVEQVCRRARRPVLVVPPDMG